jgi:hypothetical protein
MILLMERGSPYSEEDDQERRPKSGKRQRIEETQEVGSEVLEKE